MATEHFFDGRSISIPGAYSTIKSGIKNPSLALTFGNTLVIDTGSGKFFGGGSGINGTLLSGKDALYTFNKIGDFRKFERGGLHWLLAAPLFSPGGGATAGISSLTYVRALTTNPAIITLSFGSSTSDGDANDGEVEIQVNAEGYVGNGVLGDETRAKATITVTNAGAAGDSVSVTIDDEPAGTYVVEDGDTIADVVAGLSAAIDANGLSEVFSQSATQIVIYATRGAADSLNGLPATIGAIGSVAANSGNFSGGVEGTLLTRGYAAKMVAGVVDDEKFIVKFYRGTFKGLDSIVASTDAPYDAIPELSTKPELIAQSPELNTVQALVNWMTNDFNFNLHFTLLDSTIAESDEITSDDLTFYSIYEKAVGGSESFSIDDLSAVLTAISDLTFDFILSDNWRNDARSANNLAIQDWILNTAKIKPDLFIGGGYDVSEWNSGVLNSNALAVAFDMQQVSVVHGGAKKIAPGGKSFKLYDSIFMTAAVLGRIAGLAPQNPPTFKNIGVEGLIHQLNDDDVKLGLNSGVLMVRADGTSFEIVKGINTLQNNSDLVNPDGTTHSIQFGRIERQLNKELVFNLKRDLLKKPNGANRNTVKAEDVKTYVENYLQTKVATDQVDNLLISFEGVEVVRNQDAYEVTYVFEGNTEISFILSTGFVVDTQS